MLHNGACVRSDKVEEEELLGIWKEFRVRMKIVMKTVREEREKRLQEVEITKDWKNIMREMNTWNTDNIERLCGVLVRSREESAKHPSKVIKPAKVPTWSKEMSLETFEKQIQAWSQINEDVPEYSRYQDLVEGLKTNKEVKGLPGYVNDHILKVLEKKEDQTVVRILECFFSMAHRFGEQKINCTASASTQSKLLHPETPLQNRLPLDLKCVPHMSLQGAWVDFQKPHLHALMLVFHVGSVVVRLTPTICKVNL